jgi:membrane-associated phospholipid phosphatase
MLPSKNCKKIKGYRLKNFLILILLLINFCIFSQDSTGDKIQEKNKKNKFVFNTQIAYEKNRFLSQDIIEWTSMTGLVLFDGLFFHYYLKPVDKDIIPNLDHSKKTYEELLPTWLGIAGIGIAASLIMLLPNNTGFFNYEAYINMKGYLESIIVTMIIVDILKFSFAEKRPDYEARLNTGNSDLIRDGKLSFPSEHSAIAFATSTYLTFFLFQYLGDNSIPAVLALKCLLATGLTSVSFLIAWERIYLDEHYIQDVAVGGVIGVVIASFFYCFHNYFSIYKKIIDNKKFSLSIGPDSSELGIDIIIKY